MLLYSVGVCVEEEEEAVTGSAETDMGWLRLVGSLKLYVSLENIGLFYRALLQKRPVILRSLLIEATP